jgi:hypothetical protein
LSRNSPKTQNTSRAFPHVNKRSHDTIDSSLLKNPSRQPKGRNRSDRFGKPVSPVFAWTVGKNTTRGKNSILPPIDQSKTLGIVGVPSGLPLARRSVPKTQSIKRNRKSTLKNTSNSRTPKTPKSSPDLGGESKAKEPRRVHTNFPHQIPRTRSRKHTEKTTKRGLRKSPQEQPGTTQQSLEEPRRMIYTYQRCSYKV